MHSLQGNAQHEHVDRSISGLRCTRREFDPSGDPARLKA